MQKEATINSLFGETIYFAHIDNDNKKTAKHVESFVKEKPGRTAATTDVKGNTQFTDLEEAKDNLHNDSKYKELYKNIAKNINDFLKAKGYSKDKEDITGGGAIAIPKDWLKKIEYLTVSYSEK